MQMHLTQVPRETLDLRLEQTMSHQQIQALEMLTAPVLELSAIIAGELASNPVLEAEFEQPLLATDDEAWLDHLLKLSEEQRFVCGTRPRSTPEDEEKRQHFFESATYEERLHDRLLRELHLLALDEALNDQCEVVLSSLDNDGYLKSHAADLAMAAACTVDAIDRAIAIVQGLSPAGVGARDLRERLMLQLERQGRTDTLAYAVVRDYLDDVARNLLPRVARQLGVDLPTLQQALHDIQKLNPHLGIEEVSPADYVREEVIVSEEDGEIAMRVCNDYLPSLRISTSYRLLLRDPATDAETREYVKAKIRSAAYLINSVLQRQSTIERIAGAIVAVQEDFFRDGPDAMKPLTMAQVAEQVGVHETTVSRTVADKYLRCRYGLFPLKHFFSSGYVSDSGEAVSSVAVKNAIRRLVDSEAPEAPLSDSQLAERLTAMGLKVARRTVAKYREAVNIPASNLRRAYCVA